MNSASAARKPSARPQPCSLVRWNARVIACRSWSESSGFITQRFGASRGSDVVQEVLRLPEILARPDHEEPHAHSEVVNESKKPAADKTNGESPGQTDECAGPRHFVALEELTQQI